jgi:hypothetical protein
MTRNSFESSFWLLISPYARSSWTRVPLTLGARYNRRNHSVVKVQALCNGQVRAGGIWFPDIQRGFPLLVAKSVRGSTPSLVVKYRLQRNSRSRRDRNLGVKYRCDRIASSWMPISCVSGLWRFRLALGCDNYVPKSHPRLWPIAGPEDLSSATYYFGAPVPQPILQ